MNYELQKHKDHRLAIMDIKMLIHEQRDIKCELQKHKGHRLAIMNRKILVHDTDINSYKKPGTYTKIKDH